MNRKWGFFHWAATHLSAAAIPSRRRQTLIVWQNTEQVSECPPVRMERADATKCQNVISAVQRHVADICAWQTLRTRRTFGGWLSDRFVYFFGEGGMCSWQQQWGVGSVSFLYFVTQFCRRNFSCICFVYESCCLLLLFLVIFLFPRLFYQCHCVIYLISHTSAVCTVVSCLKQTNPKAYL